MPSNGPSRNRFLSPVEFDSDASACIAPCGSDGGGSGGCTIGCLESLSVYLRCSYRSSVSILASKFLPLTIKNKDILVPKLVRSYIKTLRRMRAQIAPHPPTKKKREHVLRLGRVIKSRGLFGTLSLVFNP